MLSWIGLISCQVGYQGVKLDRVNLLSGRLPRWIGLISCQVGYQGVKLDRVNLLSGRLPR